MSLLRRLFGSRRSAPSRPAPARAAPAAPGGPPSPDQPRQLTLLAFDSCPYCQRVYRAVSRLDLDVPVRNTRRDPEAADLLRSLTGRTQVPCLVIDGQPLLESADIVRWLEHYAAGGAQS